MKMVHLYKFVLIVTLCLAGTSTQAKDKSLLQFLRYYEAGGSYDRYYDGIKTPPPKPLTLMTVGEVMYWQSSLKGVKSTASGGYQFIRKTLAATVAKYKINKRALFDATMQDRLARYLIDDCATARGIGDVAFANCLAGIWAALPLVSGPNRGKSAYRGLAGNKALTTPSRVLAVIAGTPFSAPARKPGQVAPSRKIYAGGAVVLSRQQLIRRETREIRENGNVGQSVVYKRDPYALN
jgi:hypothetical protein